jgi:hypothetical protein
MVFTSCDDDADSAVAGGQCSLQPSTISSWPFAAYFTSLFSSVGLPIVASTVSSYDESTAMAPLSSGKVMRPDSTQRYPTTTVKRCTRQQH